ncbi:MAG: MMPL family transporter [Planctomycetota bacterium]
MESETKAPAVIRYAEWVIARRWLVFFASLGVVALLAVGIKDVRLAQNYRVFFAGENPDLKAFDAIEHIYTTNDNVVFLVQPPEGEHVFTERTLSLVRDLTEDSWQIPFSQRVDSLSNFQHTWAQGDDLIVEDLVPDGDITEAIAARADRVSASEPIIARRLITDDRRTTAVNVRVVLPGKDSTELKQAITHIRGMVAEYREKYPDHTFHSSGVIPANTAFAEAPERDMPFVMPLLFAALVLATTILLRSIVSTVGMFAVIFCSVLVTLGVVGLLGWMLDPASASAPTIVLTLAVADSIHILITFLDQLRSGHSRREALIESLRLNAMPVFLTSVTTAIAFLSLNLSESPPYRLLGNVTAGGVMFAWAFSMTLLPAFLAILPASSGGRLTLSTRWAIATGEWVIAHSRPLAIVVALFSVGLIAGMGRLTISDKFWQYFDESMEFRRSADFAVDTIGGLFVNSYSIDSGESQGICDPEFLGKLEEFTEWLRARPGVAHVRSFADTMKRLNKNMHGDDESYYRLPDSQELASQYLLLYELSLPYGLDLNDEIDIDKRSVRVDVTYGNVATSVLAVDGELSQTWLREKGLEVIGPSGTALMFTNITHRNLWAMVIGGTLGLSLIALVLFLVFRDVRLGFLSLMPNLTPALMAFGVWGYVEGTIGFAISVVGPLSLGIIVDDTVHFLSKYNRARRRGDDAADSLRYAFRHAGSAIFVTTIVLSIGFAMLGLSVFRVTSYMGVLTSLTIACAFIADFLLLPALLLAFDKGDRTAPGSDVVETTAHSAESETPEGAVS